MSAYVIAFMQITDHKKYETYKDQVPETIALYDGEYLARGGDIETIEGDFLPERGILLKFPTLKRAKIKSDINKLLGSNIQEVKSY